MDQQSGRTVAGWLRVCKASRHLTSPASTYSSPHFVDGQCDLAILSSNAGSVRIQDIHIAYITSRGGPGNYLTTGNSPSIFMCTISRGAQRSTHRNPDQACEI